MSWNIETCFKYLIKDKSENATLTKEQQEQIINLVNKYYLKKENTLTEGAS